MDFTQISGRPASRSVPGFVVLALLSAGIAQTPEDKPGLPTPPRLSGEQVVQRMVQRNKQRAEALHGFQGTRTYHLKYQGFAISREAEMVASVVYRAPDSKRFTVISQSGSKLIIDRVLRKLLESEQESMQAETRERTALNTDNYNFTLTDFESEAATPSYIFEVEPKSPSKFLYRGRIWVDANDFAVSRMEVEPAKSPSFWTKRSDISHTYAKVDGFWLPRQNRSVSSIRLGGQAVLTIDYTDYKILNFPAERSARSGDGPAPTSR